ncbi:MAG: 3-carboxy-cis,cis-muconate cycloisomerase [Pseudomonadota bacterium]
MTDTAHHPWLGALFGDEALSALWSADAQLAHYRSFEAALAHALEAAGRLPAGQGAAAAAHIATAPLDPAALAAGTARDGLPIPAFVRQLRAGAPRPEAIHTGATSQDVLDTALSLTLRATTELLIARLTTLDAALGALSHDHGAQPLMARTRMQAALPIKVADRIRSWQQPLADHIAALTAGRPRVERLQLGGPVGTRDAFAPDGDAIAAHMADTLGLASGPVWHSDRTAIADYAGRLSLITGSLGKIGQDVTLMAQQSLGDIALAGGGGSSAMAHKSNPILAELLVTLARFNATQLAGMHQALVHEQERSGAAWMLEWMILPQMALATGRALSAASTLCADITRLGGPDPQARP